MFTGIIERTLRVREIADHPAGRRLIVPNVWDDIVHGESIAINGVCLTVAHIGDGCFTFDVVAETLRKTNLSMLAGGDAVNAERSLRFGGRVDGHFVQGHVDATGVLIHRIETAYEWRYTIEAPDSVARYLTPKGSICVDGVSLTIANVDGRRFDVALIPTTLAMTTLPSRQIGYAFNLEADMIAKQIVTFMEMRKHTIGPVS